MVDDIMLQAEERMERALASLGEAFGSVRTGRANALLLDRIKVDYYLSLIHICPITRSKWRCEIMCGHCSHARMSCP